MKKRQFAILILVLLVLPAPGLTQEGTWTKVADMPTPRATHAAAVVNGKIYVIGGRTTDRYLSTVEEYDPATDTWARKADMPEPRNGPATGVVNGRVYVIGGWIGEARTGKAISIVEEYNPTTDTWSRKADMIVGISFEKAVGVVNNRIYVIGGWSDDRASTRYPNAGPVSIVQEYEPATDTWTRKADMRYARSGASAVAVNNKIYVIGGWVSGLGTIPIAEEYDPTADTWTRKSDMPTPRWNTAPSVVNGKIYTIGGFSGDSSSAQALPTVEVYDPAMDTWTRATEMRTPRIVSSSAINGYIYTIGGVVNPNYDYYPSKILSFVEAYDTGVGIRVTSISPSEGRVTGGELIAIFGSGFLPGAGVTIGGRPLTDVKVTDTLIVGLSPPGIEGEQDIWISAPVSTSPSSLGSFSTSRYPTSS